MRLRGAGTWISLPYMYVHLHHAEMRVLLIKKWVLQNIIFLLLYSIPFKADIQYIIYDYNPAVNLLPKLVPKDPLTSTEYSSTAIWH